MKNFFSLSASSFLLLILLFLVGCNSVNLSKDDAKALIIKTFALPQTFTKEVFSAKYFDKDLPCSKLQREGLINVQINSIGTVVENCRLSVTDKGQPYYLGEGNHGDFNSLIFKSFDVDINEITGISINKDEKTATVRFSLKGINISPIA